MFLKFCRLRAETRISTGGMRRRWKIFRDVKIDIILCLQKWAIMRTAIGEKSKTRADRAANLLVEETAGCKFADGASLQIC